MDANLTGTLVKNLPISHINDDDFGLNSELTRIWSRLHNTKHDIMQRLISSRRELRENFTIKLIVPNFELPEDAQRWASKRLREIEFNLYHLYMDMFSNTGLQISYKVSCRALFSPLYIKLFSPFYIKLFSPFYIKLFSPFYINSPVDDFGIFNVIFKYYYLDPCSDEFAKKVTEPYENISTSLYDLGRKKQSTPMGLYILFLFFYIIALVFVGIFASSPVQEFFFLSSPMVLAFWCSAISLVPSSKDTTIKKLIKKLRSVQSAIGGNRFVLTEVRNPVDYRYPIVGYIIVDKAIFTGNQLIKAPILKICSWDLNGQTHGGQYNINLKNIGFVPKSLTYAHHENGMNTPARLRENAVHEYGKINKFPFAIKMLTRRRHI